MIQYPGVLSDPPNGDLIAIRYAIMLLALVSGLAIVLSGAALYSLMRSRSRSAAARSGSARLSARAPGGSWP